MSGAIVLLSCPLNFIPDPVTAFWRHPKDLLEQGTDLAVVVSDFLPWIQKETARAVNLEKNSFRQSRGTRTVDRSTIELMRRLTLLLTCFHRYYSTL